MPLAFNDRLSRLLTLAHDLGGEARRLAILGEGNVSTRTGDDTFIVKASGHNLGSLTGAGVAECRRSVLRALESDPDPSDGAIEKSLLDCRVDPSADKPSTEALFHAYLLALPGVEYVGHTHPVAVNRVLCSPRAREFASRRMFPDEIVCCGDESVFVPYTDPGFRLALVIKKGAEAYAEKYRVPPRVILLENHGLIALGSSPEAVLAATFMCVKAADIFLGAAALGGPVFLSEEHVKRISGRSDEHYRQKVLNM